MLPSFRIHTLVRQLVTYIVANPDNSLVILLRVSIHLFQSDGESPLVRITGSSVRKVDRTMAHSCTFYRHNCINGVLIDADASSRRDTRPFTLTAREFVSVKLYFFWTIVLASRFFNYCIEFALELSNPLCR